MLPLIVFLGDKIWHYELYLNLLMQIVSELCELFVSWM